MVTQLKTFKHIVVLTTRCVGLRLVLLHCRHVQAVGTSKSCIVKLWGGATPPSDHAEWKFYLEYAASCMSDDARVAVLLEERKLDEVILVPVESGVYSVVEQLLVATECT